VPRFLNLKKKTGTDKHNFRQGILCIDVVYQGYCVMMFCIKDATSQLWSDPVGAHGGGL